MNAGLRNLIALQDIDQKIAGLQKQISEIPQKIQSFQEELQRLKQAYQNSVIHSQELAKQRRTYEGEVDMMRSRLSKLKDQLMSVKTNKEYTAMLHEIQGAENQIRSEEDKILDIMEEMETLEKELKSSNNMLGIRTAEPQASIQECELSVPALEAGVAKLHEEKALMEARVESELLARYRRIAELKKGIALAEAKDELCTACHVRIRPQVYADLLHTENIYACDSCSRILFARETL